MRRLVAVGALIAADVLMIIGITLIAGAGTAEAHDADSPPGVTALNRPDDGFLARTYPNRGCDGIAGGAQPGVDGWVFERPVTGAVAKVYGLLFATSPIDIVVLRIDGNGLHGVDVSDVTSLVNEVQAPLGGGVGSAGTVGAGTVRANAAPAGVTGGLIEGGGAWARTPAGWRLVDGALYHGNVEDSPAEFSLLTVCALEPVAPVGPAVAPVGPAAAHPAATSVSARPPSASLPGAGEPGALRAGGPRNGAGSVAAPVETSGRAPTIAMLIGAMVVLAAAGLVIARHAYGVRRRPID
jgi:hypothetical protein